MKRSKSYWVRRAAALEEALQNDADKVVDDIVEAYEQAIENINADIHQTFTAYVATGIPDGEAEKLLNSAEHDEVYEELLRLYEETEDPVTKSEIANRINAQAYGARISRLEGIKARVYTQLVHVANIAEKKQRTLYTNSLQQSYYTNIYNIAEGLNCGIDFSLLPQRAIDKVLREPWHGKNYSDRIWIHNDRFINSVQDTITTGIISGHSVNRMAESLTEYVKEGNDIRSSTEALVRTETSHFMNQGQLQAYEEIGIEKYRFVAALADNTCERCASLDGAVFERDKAVEGKNYPPLHPRCRCVTIMADAVPSTRIARDPLTGKNYKVDGSMTFAEWKDSLSDEQRAMLKYVKKPIEKSAKSDIISSIELNNIYPSSYNGKIKKEVAEKIDEVLRERKTSHLFDGAKIVKISPTEPLQTDLVQHGTFFKTILNINENALADKSVKEIDAMFNRADSTVANSLREGVIHEEYHARLVRNLNYAQAESLYERLEEIHISGISSVAYKNGAECIAEVGVLIERGEKEKVPLEALKLFEKYIGGVL